MKLLVAQLNTSSAERERERETDRQRDRDRQTDRPTDRAGRAPRQLVQKEQLNKV